MQKKLLYILGGAIIIILGLFYGVSSYSCTNIGENIDIETRYEALGGGCLINLGKNERGNDFFLPYEKWILNTGK